MAIVKRPIAAPAQPKDDDAIERFIESAPDGAQMKKENAGEGESVQITLRITKDQLERVTAVAKRQGIPRASYIKRAIAMQLEADDR